MTSNKDYLDLNSKLYKKCESLEEKFKTFASCILKQFKLNIGEKICSIEEVEIYYNSNAHKDEYVHNNKDQLTNGKWYFHQYHNGSYKGGTYKGMDITFGNGKDIYGGVLIRSIMNENDNEFITGPCNTVNYILKQFEHNEVKELVKTMKSLDIFDKKNPFHITISNNNTNEKIFTGPRVGLSLKYPEYLLKEYRYLKQPCKIQKYRSTIISSLYKGGAKDDDIITLTKLSKVSVKKAIKEFNDSKTMSDDDFNKLKPDKINQIFGYANK